MLRIVLGSRSLRLVPVAALLGVFGTRCGSTETSPSQQGRTDADAMPAESEPGADPSEPEPGAAPIPDASAEPEPASAEPEPANAEPEPAPPSPDPPAAPCVEDGDGRTTVVFRNGCDEALHYRGSDIEGGTLEPGEFACVDIGSDSEELPAKRYWAFVGENPGAEHHTLAEFTFNTDFYDFDWYNISHVDAFNLPLTIAPLERPDCEALSCAVDLLADCPEEGRHTDTAGNTVACVSPERDDPESAVATYFESCDDAYAWSGDDQQGEDPSPVRACAGEDWDLLFCPDGSATPSLPGEPSTSPDPAPVPVDALGPYPVDDSNATAGGTMTFTNVGAPGWWPRRIEREPGDPACDYKDGEDTWGGHCCMTRHETESNTLSPFDEEMTLILKAIRVKQLAIYQPEGAAEQAWRRVTAYDDRTGQSDNLWFTRDGDGSTDFLGDMTGDDCVGYVNQVPLFDCGDGADYYCPNDPGVLHQGYRGSKLVAFLGSMQFDDDGVSSCSGDGDANPGPWVAFVASELVRDGGRKWNGLCNCYSVNGSVGDGCGEINVFEVVQDQNDYSNREFASTGVRSYQAGHVGGAVCTSDCQRDDFPASADVVDACARSGYDQGPELEMGGDTDGCPVWRRPEGDRYFFILLDEPTRSIQVAILHPAALPDASRDVFPDFPAQVERAGIDGLLGLRLH